MASLLLVEDDDVQRKALRDHLCSVGWSVDDVPTSQDAFTAALRFAYDAILLDFWLPDRPGPQVIRTLRALAFRTTIVVATADPNHLERERESREAGADSFWRKGAHSLELLEKHLKARRPVAG